MRFVTSDHLVDFFPVGSHPKPGAGDPIQSSHFALITIIIFLVSSWNGLRETFIPKHQVATRQLFRWFTSTSALLDDVTLFKALPFCSV